MYADETKIKNPVPTDGQIAGWIKKLWPAFGILLVLVVVLMQQQQIADLNSSIYGDPAGYKEQPSAITQDSLILAAGQGRAAFNALRDFPRATQKEIKAMAFDLWRAQLDANAYTKLYEEQFNLPDCLASDFLGNFDDYKIKINPDDLTFMRDFSSGKTMAIELNEMGTISCYYDATSEFEINRQIWKKQPCAELCKEFDNGGGAGAAPAGV